MTEIDSTSGRPVSTTGLHILYILHAVAPFTLWSLSLVAVILGAFMRDADRGTYLESHYSWLLRTFLWGLVWLVLGTIVFVLSIVGIFLLWLLWDSTFKEWDPWFAVVVAFVLVLAVVITAVPSLHAKSVSPGEYPYDD